MSCCYTWPKDSNVPPMYNLEVANIASSECGCIQRSGLKTIFIQLKSCHNCSARDSTNMFTHANGSSKILGSMQIKRKQFKL